MAVANTLAYYDTATIKKLLTAKNMICWMMIFTKVFVTYKMWWQKWSEMLLLGTNWNSSTFLDFLTKKISKLSFVNGRWKTTTTDSVLAFHLNTAMNQSWDKCYKTFYGRKWLFTVVSRGVCLNQSLPPYSNICKLEMVGSEPCLQILVLGKSDWQCQKL